MTVVREFWTQYGTQLLYAAVTAIAGFVGIAIKNAYTRLVDSKFKQDIVKKSVQAVEQLSKNKDMQGEEKYQEAAGYAAALLQEHGINISDVELKLLIEAALAEFTSVFDKTVNKKAAADTNPI